MPTAPAAAFFDLDKTIIAKSSSLAFSRPFYKGGLINRRAVLRSGFAQFVFLVGGADHDQMERMRAYLQGLVAGWQVDQVDAIVHETLHELIDPIVYDEAVTLMEDHHAAGRDVVIVSSSGSAVVEPIGALLGADHVLATRMVVEDGAYTGDIDFYAYGDNKAIAIHRLAQAVGYELADCYAYSDSVTDVPMLEAVGHAFAVNADRGLRRAAEEHGWEQLTFATPVAMRRRLPRVAEIPPKQRIAAGAVAASAAAGAAAGVVWYASRRGRLTT
ncbi:MAG: HAD-IB family hydrolase [Actinomycetes bacterium]